MTTIREANQEDLKIVLTIYKDLDSEVLDIDTAKSYFAEIRSCPDYKVYLCYLDGVPVGTFSLSIQRNLAHMGAKSGLIEDVVVISDCRSMGIGKEMMAFAINECKRKGCYKVSLSSNFKRERAHEFYENIGFKKHGYSFLMELE